MAEELEVPRDCVHPIQLYPASAKCQLSEETNYYALVLLSAALKNAK